MKAHRTTTVIVIATLLLSGCIESRGTLKLIGSEDCIICIRDTSTPRLKVRRSPQRNEHSASSFDRKCGG